MVYKDGIEIKLSREEERARESHFELVRSMRDFLKSQGAEIKDFAQEENGNITVRIIPPFDFQPCAG
jgi:hypothetical protein